MSGWTGGTGAQAGLEAAASDLAAVLAEGNSTSGIAIAGPPSGDALGGQLELDAAEGDDGGDANLKGGAGTNGGAGGSGNIVGADDGAFWGAGVTAQGADGAHGRVVIVSDGTLGGPGDVLVRADDDAAAVWMALSVQVAEGAPAGAPAVGGLPFAYDSTAVTGGFYFWNGAAWVMVAAIL